jgi:hypothetical protein
VGIRVLQQISLRRARLGRPKRDVSRRITNKSTKSIVGDEPLKYGRDLFKMDVAKMSREILIQPYCSEPGDICSSTMRRCALVIASLAGQMPCAILSWLGSAPADALRSGSYLHG